MPEGPEVRRAADEMSARLVGAEIEQITFGLKKLKKWEERLKGTTVEGIRTFGKATVTDLGEDHHLYTHNMLYGRWYIVPARELPDVTRKLKLAIHTQEYSALLYSTSSIDVLTEEGLHTHSYLSKLGPDVLDEDVDADVVYARLEDASFTNRALGALLLDQSFLAGIGNYLRAEILWAAQVHPAQSFNGLEEAARRRLAEELVEIPRHSYACGGATSSHYLTLPEGEISGFDQYVFQAYKADGDPCPRCETTSVKEEDDGRRIYLCPTCQPTPA